MDSQVAGKGAVKWTHSGMKMSEGICTQREFLKALGVGAAALVIPRQSSAAEASSKKYAKRRPTGIGSIIRFIRRVLRNFPAAL
ncbi:MAG: twin-arginine translocation signal domain-containing protein [Planctomycetota bacterium]|jgi:hypothetical protein